MKGWEIIFICSSIALLPFMYLLLRSIIKDIKEIIGISKWEKAEKIDYNNYEELELIPIESKRVIQRGQVAFYESEITSVQIAVKQKKYTGNTRGGIKLPFFRLSLQDKELYDTYSFMNWGICLMTITNKKLIIVSYGKEPTKKEMNISSIDDMQLVDDDKTVFISLSENTYPVKISLKDYEEARLLQNALWTIRFKGTNQKNRSNNLNILKGNPISDEPSVNLKELSKSELQEMALGLNSETSVLKYKKDDLIDYIEGLLENKIK